MAEGGKVEMVAVYDDFSLGEEMLIEGFKVGIRILGVPEYPFRLNVVVPPLFSTVHEIKS